MAKIDYDRIKAQLNELKPDMNVDVEVSRLKSKLKNLSREGALLIIANKAGVKVKTDQPKADIKTISGLRDGDDYVEIAGTIVNAYELRFYEICPGCAKRVREQSGVWKCEKHGVVTAPAYSYVMNLMLDDGTERIRVTLFSKQIEKLLGMETTQVLKYKTNPADWAEVQNDLLGKQVAFRGKAHIDDYSQRMQFTSKLVYKEPKDVQPRLEVLTSLIEHKEKIPQSEVDEDLDVDEELVI